MHPRHPQERQEWQERQEQERREQRERQQQRQQQVQAEILLASQIRGSPSWHDVAHLLSTHEGHVNTTHTAAAFTHLARLGDPARTPRGAKHQQQQRGGGGGGAKSGGGGRGGSGGGGPPQAWAALVGALAAELEAASCEGRLSARQLANVLGAAVRLGRPGPADAGW